jgi:Ala-tRNA(Pro) deacylase
MHTKTVATVGGPHPGLLAWLSSSQVDYEIHEHARTQTARQTARAEGVDPRTFAKVVGVRIVDDRDALIVIDAPDQVDLVKARKVLGHETVRLLTESELAALAPDCEVGAIPAVGALFGLPTYADYAIGDDPEISFNAGTHGCAVRVDREGWERATGVIYADLVVRDNLAPAWAR